MNTQDLPDSNLDALFKKAFDSVEFDFDERNWNTLDKRLDYHTLITRLIWIVIFGILLIAVGITLYSINSGSILHHQNITENKTSSNFKASNEKKAFNKQDENKGGSSEVNIFAKKINHYLNQMQNKSTTKLVIEKTATISSFSEAPLFITGNIKEARSRKPNFSFEKKLKSYIIFQGYNYPSRAYFLNPKHDQKATKNFFSLNINLGPDISGVNIIESGLGFSRGIGIEYFIANKFSISSGMNYVKKKYSVSKGEYSLPVKSISNYNGTPGAIGVSCDIIDIPINFYFALLQNPKGRLSIGVGSSSYLMLNEVYVYNYGSYNSNSITYKIKNKNQHYFGVMNLSVAYTGLINHKFAWQIEPYYKIPLTKIAAAEVNLNTVGFNLMLKYKL